MPARFLLFLGLVLVLGSRPAPGQQTTAAPTGGSESITDSPHHDLEWETFYLINAYRQANQLPPLQWDFEIAKVARAHSRDMATGEVDFGHAGFHERVIKLSSELTGLKGAGENVFESDNPDGIAQSAVAVWLQSPPHLKNIRGDYNYSGLGVCQDKDGAIYFTQIFIKLKPSARTAQASPPVPGITTPFGLLATPATR